MSYKYRKDNRTDEQFKKDILDHSVAEKESSKIIKSYFEEVLDMRVLIEDNGIDNSGEIIKKKKISSTADYLFVFANGQKRLLEIKNHSEKYDFLTLKKNQLEKYIKEDATVVIFRENYMLLIPSDTLQIIKETYTPKIYGCYGGKEGYRLFAGDINDFISSGKIENHVFSETIRDMVVKQIDVIFPKGSIYDK